MNVLPEREKHVTTFARGTRKCTRKHEENTGLEVWIINGFNKLHGVQDPSSRVWT